MNCPDEREILRAARSGVWPRDLELHIASCAPCTELLSVSRWINRLASFGPVAHLPDADRVWVEAQLARRQAAYRAGLRPIRILHLGIYLIAALGPASWILWNWTRVRGWVAELGGGHLSWPTDPAVFIGSFAWMLAALFGVLALMTLPMILAED